MGIVGKVGSVVGILGAIGSGVGLSVHMLSNKITVENKLLSEGFQLATTDDWSTLLAAHNQTSNPNTNVFAVASGTNKDANWLKNKCKDALSKGEVDIDNYNLASQWCVKKEKISAILGKQGKKFKLLDATNNTNDTDHWPKKLEELKKSTTSINALGISKSNGQAVEITDLKEKCKSIGDVETTANDFVNKFKLAKEWCSITNE